MHGKNENRSSTPVDGWDPVEWSKEQKENVAFCPLDKNES